MWVIYLNNKWKKHEYSERDEGIRFLGLEKLDEERLAIKSLINKWIIMLCVGLFFPHRNDREWVSIKYSFNPWCAHLFFSSFIF